MILNEELFDAGRDLHKRLCKENYNISEGQGITMIALWGFLSAHALLHDIDVEELARSQLEHFIEFARDHFEYNNPVVRKAH